MKLQGDEWYRIELQYTEGDSFEACVTPNGSWRIDEDAEPDDFLRLAMEYDISSRCKPLADEKSSAAYPDPIRGRHAYAALEAFPGSEILEQRSRARPPRRGAVY